MTVIDARQVDTTPGHEHCCPFSPPQGWEGGVAAYRQLMLDRYSHLMHGQRMSSIATFARSGGVIEFDGPHAEEARRIISALQQRVARPFPA